MCPAAKYAFPSGGARGPRPTGHTRADRAVRPYNAEQARNGTPGTPSPTKGQGGPALRVARGRTEPSAPTLRNKTRAERDVGDAVPYERARGYTPRKG